VREEQIENEDKTDWIWCVKSKLKIKTRANEMMKTNLTIRSETQGAKTKGREKQIETWRQETKATPQKRLRSEEDTEKWTTHKNSKSIFH
jgi:hypothetical protein